MNCPHCEHALTPEEIKSLWARYTSSQRKEVRGQPRVPSKCEKCGILCKTARGARDHCRLPNNPAEILADVRRKLPACVTEADPFPFPLPRTIAGLRGYVQSLLDRKYFTSRGDVRLCKAYLAFLDRAERRIAAAEAAV